MYSRPNGLTDWTKICCWHSWVVGGKLLSEKTSKNIFSTFLSNIFFHGQRRALQLVLYKTRYSYICCVKLAKRPDRLDWIFLLKLKLKNRKIIFFQFKKKIPLATPGFSASKQYKRSSGIVVNWTYPGSFETYPGSFETLIKIFIPKSLPFKIKKCYVFFLRRSKFYD